MYWHNVGTNAYRILRNVINRIKLIVSMILGVLSIVLIVAIVLSCIVALFKALGALPESYVNSPFESESEWQARYIYGNAVPKKWRTGEWTTYKTTFPNKAKAYIRDSWSQAKHKHDNVLVRRWFREFREFGDDYKMLKSKD